MNAPYLALDIGLRRTGVAVSESGRIAQPLRTINWTPPHTHGLMEEILSLIREYEVATLLVGIPFGDDESATTQALKTEQIIQQLELAVKDAKLATEIVRLNEYFSTQDGAVLFPDADKDAAAAAVILQNYLEENGEGW